MNDKPTTSAKHKFLSNVPGVPIEDATSAPVFFASGAQDEIELLFDQLTSFLTKRATKYIDPISKAVYAKTPTVVVEFNGEAVPVCAVKHSSADEGAEQIVFYEDSPTGRHIGTLFENEDGRYAVVNSQDPRTIDFSDIKPYEIRDFIGTLAQELYNKKMMNRLRRRKSTSSKPNSGKSQPISDVEVEVEGGSDHVDLHHIAEPIEIDDHASSVNRIRYKLKKFAFKHPFITAESAAILLNIAFQTVATFFAHKFR